MSQNNLDSNKVCKTCGQSLEVRQTRHSPSRALKPYYYKAYYFCPNCQKIYHDEQFKVVNQTSSLFAQAPDLTQAVDIDIWTDGACSNNGKPTAKASWAFVSPLRKSYEGQAEYYEEAGRVIGKQTNNMGEGTAVLKALEWAVSQAHKVIRLHTDSQITIQNLQKPARMVKVNRELFEEIEKVIQENELVVQYVKVPGHADNVNNNRADKLANGLVGIK